MLECFAALIVGSFAVSEYLGLEFVGWGAGNGLMFLHDQTGLGYFPWCKFVKTNGQIFDALWSFFHIPEDSKAPRNPNMWSLWTPSQKQNIDPSRSISVAVGTFSGFGMVSLLETVLNDETMHAYGWRICFWLGLLVGLVGLFLRTHVAWPWAPCHFLVIQTALKDVLWSVVRS